MRRWCENSKTKCFQPVPALKKCKQILLVNNSSLLLFSCWVFSSPSDLEFTRCLPELNTSNCDFNPGDKFNVSGEP